MGTITSGIGLISGIDIQSLVDQLMQVESRGKVRLQQRLTTIQSQKTALLDVNARLLNFKTAVRSFRLNDIFDSALANSSNEDVLTASAGTNAQPGQYTFLVKQLVSTSQQLSRGFATPDVSPLGLSNLSFEFGNGRLTQETALEDLNGGQGVDRGRIVVTDSSGDTATIDLTDVTTLDEVVDRINSADDVSVQATIEGDGLVINDTADGAGSLTIANATGDTTATDLGIAGSEAGGTITGGEINFITGDTSLASLNDGRGVLVRNNVSDLFITARDGTRFNIDLGRIDEDIDDDTLLADLNDGEGVNIDSDSDSPDITFVDRDGIQHEVDLTGVTTVGGLRSRVDAETGGAITLAIASGDRLQVNDTTGGTGELQVLGGGPNGTDAAEDLGILEEDGVAADSFEGEIIPALIDQPAATTIQDVIDRINNAQDEFGVDNGGRIVASLAPGGKGIQIQSNTAVTQALEIGSVSTNPDAATALGIAGSYSTDTAVGARIVGGLDSVLIDSLNGGSGLGDATSITVRDREGDEITFSTDVYSTVGELIRAFNSDAADLGVDVELSYNNAINGLQVSDTSGGSNNLSITGNGTGADATGLGIAADVASDSVVGANLQRQYVSNASKLDDLNYGRGIGTGTFRITDGLGESASITIGGDEQTLYDVIQEINSRGLAVIARVNDTGDGLVIEQDPDAYTAPGVEPTVPIRVEAVSGTAARDLNIVGESETVDNASIDGSYERSVDVTATDSLNQIITKINDAGIPVTASLVNTGAGATPYRLNLTSGVSGRDGQLVVDTGGVDLGLSTISRGQDAKVFFGSSNPEEGFLVTSSTNTLDNVLQDVSIDLNSASDEAVTVSVSRDVDSIVEAMKQMATTFNDVIGRINDYDFYDVDSEEKGVLFGNSTVALVRNELYRTVNSPALNVDGSLKYLSQVGIRINSDGEMTFDAEAFRERYTEDPEAVEALIATYDVSSSGTEEIVEGVTIESSEQTYNALGVANVFDRLLERLTDSISGTVTRADEAFQSQIDLLQQRIEETDERLAAKRERLLNDFIQMENALAQLQTQNNALSSLSSVVANSGQSFSLPGLS